MFLMSKCEQRHFDDDSHDWLSEADWYEQKRAYGLLETAITSICGKVFTDDSDICIKNGTLVPHTSKYLFDILKIERSVDGYQIYDFASEAAHARDCHKERFHRNTDHLGSAAYVTNYGGVQHNQAIDEYISDLPKVATNIRKNQVQVDVNGNMVGNNRPDIQYNLDGTHYNVEFENQVMALNISKRFNIMTQHHLLF